MKKIILILIFIIAVNSYSQGSQNQAPWMQGKDLKNKAKTTLKEISKKAETYFKTIDRNKKGSGLKPFERWNYHWSFYTKEDGTIAPAKDLWTAWDIKNNKNKTQTITDQSNWLALGPFNSSNTYSSSSLKSSGQGRVNVIAVDPSDSNIYYLGAPAGGIWKSTDTGINWTPLTDYLPQIGVSGIAIHPTNSNIIYIATGDDDAGDSYSVGVWKSIDAGSTWSSTGFMDNPNSMNDIYITPNNTEIILVATSNGVYKSTDGGVNWQIKLTGNIIDLKMKPNDPKVWYAVSNDVFYRSEDGGDNFSTIDLPSLTDSGRLTMDVTISNNNYVYVVSSKTSNAFNGVYKSIDSGISFIKTNETKDIFQSSQAWYDLALTVSDVDPDIVYVGVLDIWKSTNGGNNFSKLTTWYKPDTDSYTHADIHFLRFIDGKFFAGTDGGIYVSTNEGVDFTDLSENLSISQFYRISVSSQNSSIVAGGLQDNGGFSYNGKKWTNYHGGDGMEGVIDPTNENTQYGFTQYGGSLNRTSNKGASLSLQIDAPSGETGTNDAGGEWVTPMASDSKGKIFAGYSQLYKLANSSWNKVSDHNFGGDDIDCVEIDPTNDNIIYVSQAKGLYKSIDAGVTFIKLSYNGQKINSMEISNSDSNVLWIVTNNLVYKSVNIKDDNPTFGFVRTNLPSETKLSIASHQRGDDNTVYLGTALGVYYINDNTLGWQVFDNNLPNVAVRDLEINEEDSKLYAGTYGRGIFVSDIPRTLPLNDVRLISIDSPKGINCDTTISPIVTIKNQGQNTLNSITFNYNLDNNSSDSYSWNGTLNSNELTEVNIPTINTSFGKHVINIESIILNDAYSNNNSYSTSFYVNNSKNNPLIINSFENSEDELLIETTNSIMWELGTPSKLLISSAATGTNAYVTKLTGNYPDGTTGYIYTNCYDLSTIASPKMAFKMAFDIELNWDYLVVEYSINRGKSWDILGTANDANWYNSSSKTDLTGTSTLPGNQWTGLGENSNSIARKNADFNDYYYDLASLSTETNIIFRFKFVSDAGTNEEGVAIDDFIINGTSLNVNDNELINKFQIYPNPSDAIFNLNWSTKGNTNITIYNYLGKKIFEKNSIKKSFFRVNLKKQNKGLYFIKLNINGKLAVKKIILK